MGNDKVLKTRSAFIPATKQNIHKLIDLLCSLKQSDIRMELLSAATDNFRREMFQDQFSFVVDFRDSVVYFSGIGSELSFATVSLIQS